MMQGYRDEAITELSLLIGNGGVEDLIAAAAMLDDYKARTPAELLLATQMIAFGLTALACLRSAGAVKSLPIKDLLDLQDAALLLQRAANKAGKALDVLRRDPAPACTGWDAAAFVAMIKKARNKMALANAKLPDAMRPAPRRAKLRIAASEPMTPAVLAAMARSPSGAPARN